LIELENDHFTFGKAEEHKGTTGTSTKGRSNRYEQNDEVDPNDIDLEAHETLEGGEIKKEEEEVVAATQDSHEEKEVAPV
jgi:hypothetical protein